MPEKMELPQSTIVRRMFERIPMADRKAILQEKAGMLNGPGDAIRLQVFMGVETYTVLKYFGAFEPSGPGPFLCMLTNEYLLRQATEMKILDRLMFTREAPHA